MRPSPLLFSPDASGWLLQLRVQCHLGTVSLAFGEGIALSVLGDVVRARGLDWDEAEWATEQALWAVATVIYGCYVFLLMKINTFTSQPCYCYGQVKLLSNVHFQEIKQEILLININNYYSIFRCYQIKCCCHYL